MVAIQTTLIELECVLAQVLPESGAAGAPFSLKEIADIAARFSDDGASYSRVHRAWATLYESPTTREIVAPLDPASRFIELSAAGARRVLRRVWNSRIPKRITDRNVFEQVLAPAFATCPLDPKRSKLFRAK